MWSFLWKWYGQRWWSGYLVNIVWPWQPGKRHQGCRFLERGCGRHWRSGVCWIFRTDIPAALDANPLQFFMVIFPLALIQIIVDNTNLYAAQSVDQGWVDYNYRRDKTFLGLQILMGIIQLPRYTMYWSSNKFMGKLYQYYKCCFYSVFSVHCFHWKILVSHFRFQFQNIKNWPWIWYCV